MLPIDGLGTTITSALIVSSYWKLTAPAKGAVLSARTGY